MDHSYLKKLDADQIASFVSTHGSLVFIGNGLSEFENAEIAVKAINHLKQQNLSLKTMFAADLSHDDSIRRIYFKVNDSLQTSWAIIDRITEYRDFGLNTKKPDKVQHGPCVKAENAQAFVDMLNNWNWGTNNGGKYDISEKE